MYAEIYEENRETSNYILLYDKNTFLEDYTQEDYTHFQKVFNTKQDVELLLFPILQYDDDCFRGNFVVGKFKNKFYISFYDGTVGELWCSNLEEVIPVIFTHITQEKW